MTTEKLTWTNIPMPRQDDFLDQLLELMNRRMDEQARATAENTRVTQRVLAKVEQAHTTMSRHETEIEAIKDSLAKVEQRGFKLPKPSQSILYLVALGSVILLLIIASLLKVNLGGLIG